MNSAKTLNLQFHYSKMTNCPINKISPLSWNVQQKLVINFVIFIRILICSLFKLKEIS
jgi:hypothetical protein